MTDLRVQHRPCTPTNTWLDRHSEIVQVLPNRDDVKSRSTKAFELRADGKLVGKSASVDNQLSVETTLSMRPTMEQVNEQWARAIVKKGLSIDLVDDPEFRAVVVYTARAGLSYVDAQKGDSLLPHRTKMSTVCIPDLDRKVGARVKKRIQGLISETGSMIISDGWTSVQNRPIINALQSTLAGAGFLKAVDTSGKVKTAEYIADFTVGCIQMMRILQMMKKFFLTDPQFEEHSDGLLIRFSVSLLQGVCDFDH